MLILSPSIVEQNVNDIFFYVCWHGLGFGEVEETVPYGWVSSGCSMCQHLTRSDISTILVLLRRINDVQNNSQSYPVHVVLAQVLLDVPFGALPKRRPLKYDLCPLLFTLASNSFFTYCSHVHFTVD